MGAFKVVSLKGKDRHDFLHRLSSQSFLQFEKGSSRLAAFLNGMGGVLFLFEAYELGDETQLATYPDQTTALLSHIEKFHFSEDLNYSETLSSKTMSVKDLIPPRSKDIASSPLLLELGLYSHFHPNKGCYPGQEVVERILTKGDVPRKAAWLQLESNPDSESEDIFFEDKRVGHASTILVQGSDCRAYGLIQRLQLDQSRVYRVGESMAHILQMANPLPRH